MFKARKVFPEKEKSDEALLALFLEGGNKEALTALFMRYSGLLYGVCLKYVEAEQARDLVMEVYQELGEKVSRHAIQNFRFWIYRVVQNHCLMYLRRMKREGAVLLEVAIMENGPELHHSEKEFNLSGLDKCLEQLGEAQRKVIELFYLKELCYQDISVETGFTPLSVKSHIQNGKRNLKICIEKYREAEIDR